PWYLGQPDHDAVELRQDADGRPHRRRWHAGRCRPRGGKRQPPGSADQAAARHSGALDRQPGPRCGPLALPLNGELKLADEAPAATPAPFLLATINPSLTFPALRSKMVFEAR